jgi:hypothetical protein
LGLVNITECIIHCILYVIYTQTHFWFILKIDIYSVTAMMKITILTTLSLFFIFVCFNKIYKVHLIVKFLNGFLQIKTHLNTKSYDLCKKLTHFNRWSFVNFIWWFIRHYTLYFKISIESPLPSFFNGNVSQRKMNTINI